MAGVTKTMAARVYAKKRDDIANANTLVGAVQEFIILPAAVVKQLLNPE